MKKIGIIGRNFGKIVASELSESFEITWQIGKNTDLSKLKAVDLVYVASPIELHYEHAKFFLNKSIPVVVEKPAAASIAAVSELVEIAVSQNTFIYFSDPFSFHEEINDSIKLDANQINWSKTTDSEYWIGFRLAYHYLYLIAAIFGVVDIHVLHAEKDKLVFSIKLSNRTLKFQFQQNAEIDEHVIGHLKVVGGKKGVIRKMVEASILNPESIRSNNEITLNAMKMLEQIRESMPTAHIVGGGVFGCQTAIEMAKAGLNTKIYEKNATLMSAASGINQYRVHRGYHYPRSDETAQACESAHNKFITHFYEAIQMDHDAYYSISSRDSRTTSDDYLRFLKRNNLEYEIVAPQKGCSLTVKVREYLFSPSKLKNIMTDRLFGMGVKVHTETEYEISQENYADVVIIAAYSWSGKFNDQEYQHELVEKPVVRLSKKYSAKSFVVMDGPFTCADPFGDDGLHILGNVVHAIHRTNIDVKPRIPKEYSRLINNGLIQNPEITKISLFQETYKEFFDEHSEFEHIGSMYTIRTVLANRDFDDARPTLVTRLGDNVIQLFSGKIVTCCDAASKATRLALEDIL